MPSFLRAQKYGGVGLQRREPVCTIFSMLVCGPHKRAGVGCSPSVVGVESLFHGGGWSQERLLCFCEGEQVDLKIQDC